MKKISLFVSSVALLLTFTGCVGEKPRTDGFVKSSSYDKAVQGSTYQEAIHQYSALYSQDKNNLMALLGLARNLRYAGQPERALEQLEGAENRFDEHPAFLTELGKAYLAKGEFRTAKNYLKDAIEKQENNWEAYSALGIAYDFERDYVRASRAYIRAIEICPDSASILNNAAISAALGDDIKSARALLRRASDLRPHSERIKNNLNMFSRLGIACPQCSADQIKQKVGATVAAQDWSSHTDLACTVGASEIVETLSHADFIDIRVEFEFDQAELLPEARATLDGLGFALTSETLKNLKFSLEGHTDAVGTEEYNQDLSERRANAVREYLVEMLGINKSRLETIGYGETRLLDKENPDSGVNRRVRVVRIRYPF
jgi:outer membrane protein OmpA-like peptidoglycan-associated protein